MFEVICYAKSMKINKQAANSIFLLLLGISAFITWKALGIAGDSAYLGEEPNLWMSVATFVISICLVLVAIYVKYRYAK